MTNDEIQIWMLIAFIIALTFSFYKVYIMFNKPSKGMPMKAQHNKLADIICTFLKGVDDTEHSSKSIFDEIIKEEILQDDEYHNFNLNRFNQLLHKLYYEYDVETLPDLIKKIKAS